MSKLGLKIAREYGEDLPSCNSKEEAEKYYLDEKEKFLDLLKKSTSKRSYFDMDFTPESLKNLEKWYFDLYENKKFWFFFKRSTFEKCMAYYFMEVSVRNNRDIKYVVDEYVFTTGKYTFGINKGLGTWNIRFSDHYKKKDNKLRTSIFREYKRIAS